MLAGVFAESDAPRITCLRLQESPSFFPLTSRTVAIFPLCSADNKVPVHLASDRLIKNGKRICQSRTGAAWRRAGRWAGGRAAVAGGRPDDRITAESEGIKGARKPL